MNAYKVKDRSAKVEKRRNAQPSDNRRSIGLMVAVIVTKGQRAKAERMAKEKGPSK